MFGSIGVPELIIVMMMMLMMLMMGAIPVALGWVVLSKTGLPGALSLIALVPVVGFLGVLCVLAFAEWPIQRELRLLKEGRAVR
jgi:hypothetical protein